MLQATHSSTIMLFFDAASNETKNQAINPKTKSP